ncbi:hypothetical protein PUN28_017189 [Cardiocondyla obscurior]|uniref:Uncharacterized protein n=1 Tax=Cardiocondyla obscurior TaxID=286306 RepID=A0AAW2END6_9HYME
MAIVHQRSNSKEEEEASCLVASWKGTVLRRSSSTDLGLLYIPDILRGGGGLGKASGIDATSRKYYSAVIAEINDLNEPQPCPVRGRMARHVPSEWRSRSGGHHASAEQLIATGSILQLRCLADWVSQ